MMTNVKLPFGLTQLKMGPAKDEDRIYRAVAPLHTPPGESPPPSPYPGKRSPLPQKVEAELRAACMSILQNPKPSHIPVKAPARAPKAQLDYGAIKKSFSDDGPGGASAARPTHYHLGLDIHDRETADRSASIDAHRHAYRPEAGAAMGAAAAAAAGAAATTNPRSPSENSSDGQGNQRQRRADLLTAEPPRPRRKASGSMSQTVPIKLVTSPPGEGHDRPRMTRPTGSHGTSGSTPRTDVTEYPWSTSTAPTSAGVTPARASKRGSAQMSAEPETHDGNPIDWMRHEYEKRRRQYAERSRRPSESGNASRPRSQSRARSITRSIKEYIRPGSQNASRATSRPMTRSASRASARTTQTSKSEHDHEHDNEHGPPSGSKGWHSWARLRSGSTRGDLSRSNSTKSIRGRSESRKAGSTKQSIDLNRALPPLPKLDQWKDDEFEPHHDLRPAPEHGPQHATTVQSSGERCGNNLSPHSFDKPAVRLARQPSVSEKDEIVAARLGNPIRIKPDVYQPKRIARKPVPASPAQAANAPANNAFVARSTDTGRGGSVREGLYLENHPVASTYHTPAHSQDLSSHSRNLSNVSSSSATRHLDMASRIRDVGTGDYVPASMSPPYGPRSGVASPNTNFSRVHHGRRDSGSSPPTFTPTAQAGFSQHRKYDKSHMPPALHSAGASSSPSNHSLNSRSGTITRSSSVSKRYNHMVDVEHAPPLPSKDDKKWWKLRGKRSKPQMTWMDQLEKIGIRDGVLLNDEVAGSPVVRF